jgi:hypothetical protein
MEAFLMPQTLVNADNITDSQTTANPALDKFRPFLSLKEFSLNEVQSFEAYGYQTGKLSFTLHDRSRLSQIAEFVKADIRGGTELLIEFGWCHMEAEQGSNPNNIYADIINGMRKRLKFQVINSSFTFDDNGQVEVTLDLATLGEASLTTESSVGDGVNVTDTMQFINNITQTIGEIRNNSRILNPPASSTTTTGQQQGQQRQQSTGATREIRGVQFLNVAQDAYSNLTLSREQQQEMRTLLNSLQHMPNVGEATRLKDLLRNLYGEQQGGTGRRGGGAVERLRTQIQNQVRDKMNSLKKNNDDPFLVSSNVYHSPAAQATRIAARRRAATARREREAQEAAAAQAAREAQAARDAADFTKYPEVFTVALPEPIYPNASLPSPILSNSFSAAFTFSERSLHCDPHCIASSLDSYPRPKAFGTELTRPTALFLVFSVELQTPIALMIPLM